MGINATGINSPGDYLVHNPVGRYAAVPQSPAGQAAPALQAAGARRLSWRRLMPEALRRR